MNKENKIISEYNRYGSRTNHAKRSVMKNTRKFLVFLRGTERHHQISLTILLGLQILTVFVAAPLIDHSGRHYHWITDILFALMALVSIFIASNNFKRWVALFNFTLCLIGLALGQMLSNEMLTNQNISEVIIILSGLLFSANVSWIVANQVFNDGAVPLQRIQGAIVIYLNIALLFALIESLFAWFVPEAYIGLPENMGSDTIGNMIYFSLTTLTTTGYGDLVPSHPFARSLAMFEAVVGQFYMGILISTLVGMHVSHRQNNHSPKIR